MDQIVGQALMTFNRIDETVPRRNTRRTLPLPAPAEAAADA
jgi:hypothetical protein